jgi:hypothetical protein
VRILFGRRNAAASMFSAPFVGHGEISVAANTYPDTRWDPLPIRLTMFDQENTPLFAARRDFIKIFVKFEYLAFEESSR